MKLVLKSYIFRNAWPTTITAIALDAAAATAIETFECTSGISTLRSFRC